MKLHPLCPLCHRHSVAVMPLGDLGYGVGCRGTDPECHYLIRPFRSNWTEQDAIQAHNRNVERFKQALKSAYQEGQDSMTYDEQNADDWLKGKGL